MAAMSRCPECTLHTLADHCRAHDCNWMHCENQHCRILIDEKGRRRYPLPLTPDPETG